MPELAIASTISTPVPSFQENLLKQGCGQLRRTPLQEIQINVGKLCNQACNHCHVDAGPKRTEIMSRETMERILGWIQRSGIKKVDITGGAPELNPSFRKLVESLVRDHISVTVRCNLTVLHEPQQDDLAQWYAAQGIRLVCSLPCYSQENVDAQRGKGVFAKSIDSLRRLNAAGYGREEKLPLDLVYNPNGAFLPPAQARLESEYKRKLRDQYGVVFTRLLTLTNLPISRFHHYLTRTAQEESYWQLLYDNFNADTLEGLMCRHLISIDWKGRTYDCDFNQMLGLRLPGNPDKYIWDLDIDKLNNQPVAVADHCFGCTAGAGSSCGGAISELVA
ncbi:MAG: arsenosugar biosynthesis radical SAM protein ArsS [Gammaproteobacteria bacterium]|nr:MAG: arsenosugar biosynthesis radical SAM protein ArsS [Gammaproteobacteria bacterium]